MTTATQQTEQTKITGKWDRQADGSWAVSVRVGGRGAEFVGREVDVMAKDKSWAHVTLGEMLADYGKGDVAIFRAIK